MRRGIRRDDLSAEETKTDYVHEKAEDGYCIVSVHPASPRGRAKLTQHVPRDTKFEHVTFKLVYVNHTLLIKDIE
jgi:hypothetical protein